MDVNIPSSRAHSYLFFEIPTPKGGAASQGEIPSLKQCPAKEEGMLLMLQLADQLPACAKTSYTVILYSELCIKRKIIRVPEVNAVGAGLPLIPDRALLSVRQRTNLKSPVSG
ncbi:hypothetical protein Ancab_039455 [Ancistrocladus abbreviatus]